MKPQVVTVDSFDHAREEIEAARECGADPAVIAQSHIEIGMIMKAILQKEEAK